MTIALPARPTTAEDFIALMSQIWADHVEPAEDGGITVYASRWYDDWHDARKVARELGAVKLWAAKSHGESGYAYEFPDGERVWIETDGNATRLIHKH